MTKSRDNRKSENKKFAIVLILLAVLVAGCIAGILFYRSLHTPKAKVMLAISKTFGQNSLFAIMSDNESFAGNGTLLQDYFHDFSVGKQTLDAVLSGNFSSTAEFTLEELDYPSMNPDLKYLHGTGFRFTNDLLRDQSLSRQKYELRYNSTTLLTVEAYADEQEIALTSEPYLDGYITVVPLHLGEAYNESFLATLLQKPIPEEYAKLLSFHPLSVPDKTNPGSLYRFIVTTEGMAALRDFYEMIQVTETGEKEPIPIAGEIRNCPGYEVLLPFDAISDFLTDYFDWAEEDIGLFLEENEDIANALVILLGQMGENAKDERDIARYILQDARDALKENDGKDLTFQVYLSPSGELVRIQYEDDFILKEKDYTIDAVITWHGAEQLTDETDLTLAFSLEEAQYDFLYHKSGETLQTERLDEMEWSLSRNDVCFITNRQSNSYHIRDKELTVRGELSLLQEGKDFLCEELWQRLPADLSYETILRVETDTKENEVTFSMEDCILHFTDNDFEGTLGFSANASFAPLSENDISKPDGPEYRIMEMNLPDLLRLGTEIYDNIKNSMLYELLQNL